MKLIKPNIIPQYLLENDEEEISDHNELYDIIVDNSEEDIDEEEIVVNIREKEKEFKIKEQNKKLYIATIIIFIFFFSLFGFTIYSLFVLITSVKHLIE